MRLEIEGKKTYNKYYIKYYIFNVHKALVLKQWDYFRQMSFSLLFCYSLFLFLLFPIMLDKKTPMRYRNAYYVCKMDFVVVKSVEIEWTWRREKCDKRKWNINSRVNTEYICKIALFEFFLYSPSFQWSCQNAHRQLFRSKFNEYMCVCSSTFRLWWRCVSHSRSVVTAIEPNRALFA